ncbi:MAG: ATP-binding protein [Clostridium sp.]|uniref:ATP-binding protein n=1 Tax=Clostridium sp. TaxID=1506 RepID=UPI0030711CFF
MINESTINKLNEMRLNSMAESYRNQLEDSSFKGLSFEDRFGLLVDNEWARRKNNKLDRLIRKSEIHFTSACVEDIE